MRGFRAGCCRAERVSESASASDHKLSFCCSVGLDAAIHPRRCWLRHPNQPVAHALPAYYHSATRSQFREPHVMSYEGVPVSRIFEELDAAVPEEVFVNAQTDAVIAGIKRLADDPDARGDVVTQLTRPPTRCPNSNEWAHVQADHIMLRMMQVIIDRTHASSEGDSPAIFQGWVTVSQMEGSHRHLVFRMYVIRKMKRRRSLLQRSLYYSVLYYLFHREEDNVSIRMLHPDAEPPRPSEAKRHPYFAYIKKRVVGRSARVTDTDDEDVPAGPDGSALHVLRECLFESAHLTLNVFLGTLQQLDSSAVFAMANCLRNLVTDTSFNWHALAPPDHQGLFISAPRAYRLLLPRPSTRARLEHHMYTVG